MKVDTIRRPYNLKERTKLDNELCSLETQREKALSLIPNEECYDDEYDSTYEKYKELILSQFRKCFAAQFPKTYNKWFINIVYSLPLNKWKNITAKQYYAFSQYAGNEDCDSWKTGESYCRVDNMLVTLIWKNSHRAIKVESLS